MDATEFRRRGEEIVDYIVDYLESISERPVTPNVLPGYLRALLPETAPKTGESFEKIMKDFERCIIPGLTQWQHRRFHAFFPANVSFPSLLAEMVSDGIGCEGFNWNISPAGTELEEIVMDWFGKTIGLPDEFLYQSSGSTGGGFIRNSASECVFINMLIARHDKIEQLQRENTNLCPAALLPILVAYCSKESHACVEKAALIQMVTIKILDTDKNFCLRGETLARAMDEDIKNKLVPFFVSISVGSTSCCSCDPVDEIGSICKAKGVWLHVDCAYAGSAFICPEYRPLMKGIEYASSVNVNPVKWMLVNMDCSVMWVKDQKKVKKVDLVDKTLLSYDLENHWHHTSCKRFSVFKLLFVIRNYGVEGLQKFIRRHVELAKQFASYVRKDERFELMNQQFGLVCFRLKGSNVLNKSLLMAINSSGKLLITPCQLDDKYCIRFCVCAQYANEEDIVYAWSVFCDFANEFLKPSGD